MEDQDIYEKVEETDWWSIAGKVAVVGFLIFVGFKVLIFLFAVFIIIALGLH